mgnify:CR=1 FL=1
MRDIHGLVRYAARDPEGLLSRLVPEWAVPPSDFARMAEWVRDAARWALRNRDADAFLRVLDAICVSVPLREEVAGTLRPRRKRPGVDGSRLREVLENLEEIASRYTKLRRSGKTLVGLCPIHPERNPSFHVYPDHHFHCFGCGSHGDAADLVAAVEGVSRKEAIRMLLRGEVAKWSTPTG